MKRMDFSGIDPKAERAHEAAIAQATIAAREDTKPFVPFLTGQLRSSAETQSKPEEGLLVYGSSSVPYGRAQYYGLPNKSTPGTMMLWFEHSKALFRRNWERVMKAAYKQVFGG